MTKKWLTGILFTAGFILIAGCGQTEENGAMEVVEQNQQEPNNEKQQDSGQEDTAGFDENLGQLGDDNLFSALASYQWEEITISIPDLWEGRYQVEEGEDGFTLIQAASAKKEEGMGFLCGFYRTSGMVNDISGATPLAYGDGVIYYMEQPTDVPYFTEDPVIAKEYQEMAELINDIAATVSIDKEGIEYNPEEFICPLSDSVLLKEEELLNLSDNQLAIARNEIYARHKRQFADSYLAGYFESCSWYEGSILPEQFDESVLSQTEKDNLEVIKNAEKAYMQQYPYPKQYGVGSKVSEDLDGDGSAEQIEFTLQEMDGGYKGKIVIDGKEFKLEDYDISFINPETETFYVTDISPYYEGLEIAVLDYGPSDDPETHFFVYEDGLTHIGGVTGFPFKQFSGYNGFANDGKVTGQIRLDFTHTCYAYGSWWYYENQKLEYQDTGYYQLLPEGPHRLLEDITVYGEMDEKHLKYIFPAQEKVFFLETDGKEWVLIKGKDGTKGYMHIVDGKISGSTKEVGEVFSDLNFVD